MISAELETAVERLERLVAAAPSVPLTTQVRLDRAQLERALAEIVAAAQTRPREGFRPAGLDEAVEALSQVCERARPIPLTAEVRIERAEALTVLQRVRAPDSSEQQPSDSSPDSSGGRGSAALVAALWVAVAIAASSGIPNMVLVPLAAVVIGVTLVALARELILIAHDWRRLRPRHIVVLVMLVAFVAQRVAGPGTEQPSAEEVIAEAHTSDDPAICFDLFTPEYLEERAGFRGERALARCVERVEESRGARSVTSSVHEVSSESATADVETTGTSAEGLRRRLRLERVEGQWVIAELLDVEVDRARYLRGLREHLTRGTYRLTPKHADCMVRRVGELSTAELEQSLARGKKEHRLFGDALVACDRAAVVKSFKETYETPNAPYLASAQRCFGHQLEQASNRKLVEYLYGDPLALVLTLLECGRDDYMRWFRQVLLSEPHVYSKPVVNCVFLRYSELDDRELASEILSPTSSLTDHAEDCKS